MLSRRCSTIPAVKRIAKVEAATGPTSGVKSASYPPISSIPRTSAARLALSSPDTIPDGLVPASSLADLGEGPAASLNASAAGGAGGGAAPGTVLYLAYGSNMAASVFLGVRGIRPLSQVNVSAPTLRLTFDLAGLPYREPCFANTATRKMPNMPTPPPIDPPRLPPEIPNPPNVRLPPYGHGGGQTSASRPSVVGRTSHGDPEWNKGLLGVVYEVTRSDYAKIVATEGGGTSYHDVLVPCIELPPSAWVPEKPPVPELPRPFLAHTLFAPPSIPADGGDGGENNAGVRQGSSSGDGDDDHDEPPTPPWWARFLTPRRRPDPEYAQPSLRYLDLLRDGAREHDLPAEYQAWLAALAHYQITSTRQKVGAALEFLLFGPFLLLVFGLGSRLTDEDGKLPLWMAVLSGMLFEAMWWVYDNVLKGVFGDGERTEAEEEEARAVVGRGRKASTRRRFSLSKEPAPDEEKRGLMQDTE